MVVHVVRPPDRPLLGSIIHHTVVVGFGYWGRFDPGRPFHLGFPEEQGQVFPQPGALVRINNHPQEMAANRR